jgi:hypothetical protein
MAIGSAIRIGENSEAREVDPPALLKFDPRLSRPLGEAPASNVVADRAKDGAQRLDLAGTNRRQYRQRARQHRR